jgi:trigger factor
VNVTVENLAPCKKLVRVEVETEKVDQTFETVTQEVQRHASLPGFRPGKAPRAIVLRKYDKHIQDKVREKLISDTYRQAIEEQKLDVLGMPDIEEIQFSRGQPLQFAATVETAPEFELPEYKGLPAQIEQREVTDEDVERALLALREPRADFKTVERAVQAGDVAVVNYTGTCEGKPITEVAPTAQGLTERKNFWIDTGSDKFIPGFAQQLIGAKAGEQRIVQVDFPADFVTPQLAGKHGVYDVQLVETKERVLPAVDEAFAKAYGAENVEQLRAGVRRDLGNELTYQRHRTIRNQLVRGLLDRVNFELPESSLARETRNVVYDLVQENTKRGVTRAAIEQHKDEIFSAATQGAKGRVKTAFLMQRIAEKEDIKVSEEEILRRVQQLAGMYQIPPQKFLQDLQKRNGLIEVYDQVMAEKVLDLLQQHAQIQEVPPSPPAAPAANPS